MGIVASLGLDSQMAARNVIGSDGIERRMLVLRAIP
jgi:hypothetical protein